MLTTGGQGLFIFQALLEGRLLWAVGLHTDGWLYVVCVRESPHLNWFLLVIEWLSECSGNTVHCLYPQKLFLRNNKSRTPKSASVSHFSWNKCELERVANNFWKNCGVCSCIFVRPLTG